MPQGSTYIPTMAADPFIIRCGGTQRHKDDTVNVRALHCRLDATRTNVDNPLGCLSPLTGNHYGRMIRRAVIVDEKRDEARTCFTRENPHHTQFN